MPAQFRAIIAAILAAIAGALGLQWTGDPLPVVLAAIAWVAGAIGDWYATRHRDRDPGGP